MRRPIENNSSPGQAVYEPFCGSGSTIIAAEMTGRACHAIELNPAYVDVAIRRWQDFTGDAAVLAGNGCTFDQATDDVRRASTAATDRWRTPHPIASRATPASRRPKVAHDHRGRLHDGPRHALAGSSQSGIRRLGRVLRRR